MINDVCGRTVFFFIALLGKKINTGKKKSINDNNDY